MKYSVTKYLLPIATLFLACNVCFANNHEDVRIDGVTYPPYNEEQKVVFEFYFDDPQKIATALFWLRAYMNPLMDHPYNMAPEFLDIKVIIHGTEIVTLAKHNYKKYKEIVERMRYYSGFGIEFRVCNLAAHDYGYSPEDFHDFVIVTPSAMTEMAHWQQEGYTLIIPQVLEKKFTIEEIR